MAYYLALDVGGTKTDYALADDTRELARVRTGTIKRMRTDAASAAANLDSALTQLSAETGVTMQQIARTCIGTAGESVALVVDWLREAFAARVAGELELVGDVEIALDAAFHGGPGVLAMAGTGSNVAGRTHDGRLTGAGGWGPAIADQGSGHRIGLEGLRAAFLAKDEGRATLLMEAIMGFWRLDSVERLIEFGNSVPPPDFSRLTELVLQCANEGDAIAGAVLRKEGEELGYLVRLVLRRMAAAAPDAGLPSIAFTGSILEKVLPVREALLNDVRREFPGATSLDGVVDPLDGALWRARTVGVQVVI